MPRELPLRTLGAGQLIPCHAVGSGLADGCVFPTASRVSSAHAQLLLIDCRFIAMVLSRQDSGRGLNDLSRFLYTEYERIADLRDAQRSRWKDELAAPHGFRQRPDPARGGRARAAHRVVLQPGGDVPRVSAPVGAQDDGPERG